ncbi:ATP-grasp fold amidoligase family protein [Anditalea andensis]|nr:ATP-grasp fold amidoligase family protein [Anditalea andensis]
MEKLYSRIMNPLPIFSQLADKVEVRNYVKRVLGPEYLIPLYGVYDSLTEEDLNELPSSFVLKANHGAGFYKVVADKSQESISSLVSEANHWLSIDYSKRYFEKHYGQIIPKLIAEKALLVEGKSPTDYKVHVFNRPEGEEDYLFIQVMAKCGGKMQNAFFLESWDPAPFKLRRKGVGDIESPELLAKPAILNELINASKVLAKPFSYARVDFYIYEGKLYFGEITFSHAAGNMNIEPEIWNMELGKMFSWPDRFSL